MQQCMNRRDYSSPRQLRGFLCVEDACRPVASRQNTYGVQSYCRDIGEGTVAARLPATRACPGPDGRVEVLTGRGAIYTSSSPWVRASALMPPKVTQDLHRMNPVPVANDLMLKVSISRQSSAGRIPLMIDAQRERRSRR